jgi:hypothetical protein
MIHVYSLHPVDMLQLFLLFNVFPVRRIQEQLVFFETCEKKTVTVTVTVTITVTVTVVF